MLVRQVRNKDVVGWKAQDMGSPLKTWTSFATKKAISKDTGVDRRLRHDLHCKAATAAGADQAVVDLASVLMLLKKKGKQLTMFRQPVEAIYYCSVDMTKGDPPGYLI